jgi:hypothetical protein
MSTVLDLPTIVTDAPLDANFIAVPAPIPVFDEEKIKFSLFRESTTKRDS